MSLTRINNGAITDGTISAADLAATAVTDKLGFTPANSTHTSATNNPHSVTAAQVGLGNVNNTSDADKPISTATQTALNAKQAVLVSGTNIKTISGTSLLGSGDIQIQGTPDFILMSQGVI
jgi:hypothetical protein